jgi:hypothetical protein
MFFVLVLSLFHLVIFVILVSVLWLTGTSVLFGMIVTMGFLVVMMIGLLGLVGTPCVSLVVISAVVVVGIVISIIVATLRSVVFPGVFLGNRFVSGRVGLLRGTELGTLDVEGAFGFFLGEGGGLVIR